MRSCKKCGKTITSRYKQVRYCSPACWYSTNREHKQHTLKFRKRKATQRECLVCGKQFWKYPSAGSRKFCSASCSAKYARRQVEVCCSFCGRKFTRGAALVKRVKNVFCDTQCCRLFKVGKNSSQWRGGQDRHYRGPDWPKQSRLARKQDGYVCKVCGVPQAKGEKLSVDHIVPYRLVLRNDLINLISTCRKCHNLKTQTAEADLLRGDYLGFYGKLNAANWPMDRVNKAIQWWESLKAESEFLALTEGM